MVIARSMATSHSIRDIVQISQELPAAAKTPVFDKRGRKSHYHHLHHHHRHHHHHHHRNHHHNPRRMEEGEEGGSNRGPSAAVVAGEDLPAHVTGGPLDMMPPIGRDLVPECDKDPLTTGPRSNIHIINVDGRLDTENRDGLSCLVTSLKSARDRHEQNVELIRDGDNPTVFCVRTIKPIRRGQPFLIWYGEGLAREMGVPVLTPANIRGNQEYVCTACHSIFCQPNVLKAHVFLQCSHSCSHSARQSPNTLVPFYAFLENISTRFTSSSTRNPRDTLKSESTPIDQRQTTNPLVVEIPTGDNLGKSKVSASPYNLLATKFHYNHTDKHRSSDMSNMEHNQIEVSPSSSSSSFDSSFIDEDDNDSTAASPIGRQRSPRNYIVRSAFHRPSKPSKRRGSPEVTSQIPDSSTDQRSALNLSVKDDRYSIIDNSTRRKPFLAPTSIRHPWPTPANPPHSQHIDVFPINYNTLPVYYPIPGNNAHIPSTSFNYMPYYNPHQIPRTFNIHRDSFESQNAPNTESLLPGQSSPKREHAVSYPTPESCPSMDSQVSPMNPYGLSLPSDKEPLDLLPQTFFTNKSKRGHLCLYCGKLYSRKYGLKIHMRTHNGYKPLKCKICSRPFGDPSNLNKHVRLHAQGETPYRCDYCGKVLVRRRDLERHVRSRHPMGSVPIDTSSPPSSPISVEDIDT